MDVVSFVRQFLLIPTSVSDMSFYISLHMSVGYS